MKLRSAFRAAFTLMEIMLVVAIIAILAGLLIRNMGGTTDTARFVATKADLGTIKTNLLQYSIKSGGSLPSTEQGLKALVVRPESEPKPLAWDQIYEEMPLDPWRREYVYLNPGVKKPKSFDLFSVGADGKPNTEDDIWQETVAPK